MIEGEIDLIRFENVFTVEYFLVIRRKNYNSFTNNASQHIYNYYYYKNYSIFYINTIRNEYEMNITNTYTSGFFVKNFC